MRRSRKKNNTHTHQDALTIEQIYSNLVQLVEKKCNLKQIIQYINEVGREKLHATDDEPDCEDWQECVLFRAARDGNLGVIQALESAGADLNHRCAVTGKNTLTVALEAQKYDVAKYLLNRGVSVIQYDERYSTFSLIMESKDPCLLYLAYSRNNNLLRGQGQDLIRNFLITQFEICDDNNYVLELDHQLYNENYNITRYLAILVAKDQNISNAFIRELLELSIIPLNEAVFYPLLESRRFTGDELLHIVRILDQRKDQPKYQEALWVVEDTYNRESITDEKIAEEIQKLKAGRTQRKTRPEPAQGMGI